MILAMLVVCLLVLVLPGSRAGAATLSRIASAPGPGQQLPARAVLGKASSSANPATLLEKGVFVWRMKKETD